MRDKRQPNFWMVRPRSLAARAARRAIEAPLQTIAPNLPRRRLSPKTYRPHCRIALDPMCLGAPHYRRGLQRLRRCAGAVFLRPGGRGGIRTHGTLAGTPVFKTGALNHSATLPSREWLSLNAVGGARQREVGALASTPSPRPLSGERQAVPLASLNMPVADSGRPVSNPEHWRHLPGRRRLRGPVGVASVSGPRLLRPKAMRRPQRERRLEFSMAALAQ